MNFAAYLMAALMAGGISVAYASPTYTLEDPPQCYTPSGIYPDYYNGYSKWFSYLSEVYFHLKQTLAF